MRLLWRVGNVLTLDNERLRAERLTGGEAGASFATADARLAARATVFFLSIDEPVANSRSTHAPPAD